MNMMNMNEGYSEKYYEKFVLWHAITKMLHWIIWQKTNRYLIVMRPF